MISEKQLLTLLIGAAIGAAGWMYHGDKSTVPNSASIEGLENQLRIAQEEIDMLHKENESLRSLAQGGGEVSVPQELIAKVEKDFGLKFISNPIIHRIAAEELGYRIEAALESRVGPQGMDDRQEAYQRIGWLSADDQLLKQLVAIRSVGAVAWFDEQVGEGWVTDKFDIKNVPDQAAMVRLLVRILLNQHFPAAVTYPGDDAARSREALHAGAASGAESRYLTDSARTIGFMPMTDNSATERLMLSLPPFMQGLTVFPIVSGMSLANNLYLKGGTTFSDALRNAPQTTYHVVYPAEKGRAVEVKLPETNHETYLTESAGYLGLRLWLEELGDVGLAEEIAREWTGDAYTLFADGDTSTGLIWDIEFQDEKAAGEFAAMAKQRAEAMKEISKDRHLGVGKVSTKRVRFLNVATAQTLSTLMPK